MALVSEFHLIKLSAEPQSYFGGLAQSNGFVLLKGQKIESVFRESGLPWRGPPSPGCLEGLGVSGTWWVLMHSHEFHGALILLHCLPIWTGKVPRNTLSFEASSPTFIHCHFKVSALRCDHHFHPGAHGECTAIVFHLMVSQITPWLHGL